MTQTQLITKWRGEQRGGKLVFPTLWHKRMFLAEKRGVLPQYKKRPQITNTFFKGAY